MNYDTAFRLLGYSILFFFFFFQAEDGIRDGTVTGVQTCALPIYGQVLLAGGDQDGTTATVTSSAELYHPATGTWSATGSMTTARAGHTATLLQNRSEERRVGKSVDLGGRRIIKKKKEK